MTPTCPVCQYNSTRFAREYRAALAGSDTVFGELSLYTCANCSLTFADPMPTDESLTAYYQQDYRHENSQHRLTTHLRLLFQARARAQAALIQAHNNGTSWLDIGSGYGFLLDEARKLGYNECTAVELDAHGRNRLQQQGYTVFDKLEDNTQRYDVITFSHLLEHITNPLSFLANVRQHLTENSIVYCEVPHIVDVSKPENDAPHTLFFNAKSLRFLFEQSGFRVIHCNGYGTSWSKFPPTKWQTTLTSLMRRLLPYPPQAIDTIINQGMYAPNVDGIYLRLIARKSQAS